jgi:hypothetical protein
VQKNVKIDLYNTNICNHEHEKNMIRLWCKIMPNIGVKYIDEKSYFYLYPFGDLVQGSVQGGFYVRVK